MRIETTQGAVDRAYRRLKEMAATYEFKPDERLNEGALSAKLDISRTPLREALNRLTAEGFLTFKSGYGFSCRSLKPQEIMDLYEARTAIESEAARLAARRATPAAVADLERFLSESAQHYSADSSAIELIRIDEAFHRRLAELGGNRELVHLLDNIAGRIHYIRIIDLQALSERQGADQITTDPHARILAAVKAGDESRAVDAIRSHITRRLEEVTHHVRTAYSLIYAP